MNSLVACPHCHGAISRVTRICPDCGHGHQPGDRQHEATPQSTFLMVLDALRPRFNRRRSVEARITEVVRDS